MKIAVCDEVIISFTFDYNMHDLCGRFNTCGALNCFVLFKWLNSISDMISG